MIVPFYLCVHPFFSSVTIILVFSYINYAKVITLKLKITLYVRLWFVNDNDGYIPTFYTTFILSVAPYKYITHFNYLTKSH